MSDESAGFRDRKYNNAGMKKSFVPRIHDRCCTLCCWLYSSFYFFIHILSLVYIRLLYDGRFYFSEGNPAILERAASHFARFTLARCSTGRKLEKLLAALSLSLGLNIKKSLNGAILLY